MHAIKVFSNNAVSVEMPDGEEAVILGKGIGFARRPGDVIDPGKAEKVFYIRSDMEKKFLELIKDTRECALDAAIEILEHAKDMGLDTGNHLILSLTDHINFAIDRKEQGIELPYLMLSETRLLYPKEFECALWALEKISDICQVRLPEYEAGNIALQLASCATAAWDRKPAVPADWPIDCAQSSR